MTTAESAKRILDSLLGHLGFAVEIELQETADGPCLQIHCGDPERITGRDGDRLDDLQYMVNKILRHQNPEAGRVRVDCEHFRSEQQHRLEEEVLEIAKRVKTSGKPFRMRPLNAYYRRIVHNVLLHEPDVASNSPGGDDRLKRINISATASSPSSRPVPPPPNETNSF